MALVHARIVVHPNGEVHYSDDAQRGFMNVKDFIETYNGELYNCGYNNSWISCDKRNGCLIIDFGGPAG